MLTTLPLMMMLAASPQEPTTTPATPPRYREGAQMPQDPDQPGGDTAHDGAPTDPLFDREVVATDDPAFILSAVENSRQGVVDARSAAEELASSELRAAAEKIGAQNQRTTQRLEKLASARGWRLPQANPGRESSQLSAAQGQVSGTRANANFILNQIRVHQATLAQYQAQIAGKGDAELKRVLRDSLPGYRANLEMLLTLKP